MTAKRDCLVVGAGFRGLVAAHDLAEAGHRVTVVERAPFIGGVMHSMEFNGLFLDNGCHLFDNANDDSARLLHTLHGDAVRPVRVRYASWSADARADGFAIPDFSALCRAEAAQALLELIEAAVRDRCADNLADDAVNRFGPTLGARVNAALGKILRCEPAELDPGALNALPLKRLALLSPDVMEFLKRHPALDRVLAVSTQDDPMRFVRDGASAYPYRTFYPARRGLRGFCDSAQAVLTAMGVDFRLRCAIASIRPAGNRMTVAFGDGASGKYDTVFWGSSLTGLGSALGRDCGDPEDLVHHVPCLVVHFLVPASAVADLTYVHDFRPGTLVYRGSTPGTYGAQTNADGLTYVTLEVPATPGEPVWTDTPAHVDAIWQETQALGLVSTERFEDFRTVHAKVTYSVPRKGYGALADMTAAWADSGLDGLVVPGFTAFSKEDIIQDTRHHLREQGLT